MTDAKIPNFNTLSTLLDRLSIENVKLAHFENTVENDDPSPEEAEHYRAKIETQHQIINALKAETVSFMEEVFLSGKYEYTKEERTFE